MARQEPKIMTPQQRAFVDFYLVDFNATRAAKKAGYAPANAHTQAHDLLKHPVVSKEIQAGIQKCAKKNEILKARVLKQLELIAFSNMKDYGSFDNGGLCLIPSDELADELASVIQEISVTRNKDGATTKFKLAPKEKALEMLGRHLGLFNDKLEITAPEPFIVRRLNGESVEMGVKKKEE